VCVYSERARSINPLFRGVQDVDNQISGTKLNAAPFTFAPNSSIQPNFNDEQGRNHQLTLSASVSNESHHSRLSDYSETDAKLWAIQKIISMKPGSIKASLIPFLERIN